MTSSLPSDLQWRKEASPFPLLLNSCSCYTVWKNHVGRVPEQSSFNPTVLYSTTYATRILEMCRKLRSCWTGLIYLMFSGFPVWSSSLNNACVGSLCSNVCCVPSIVSDHCEIIISTAAMYLNPHSLFFHEFASHLFKKKKTPLCETWRGRVESAVVMRNNIPELRSSGATLVQLKSENSFAKNPSWICRVSLACKSGFL